MIVEYKFIREQDQTRAPSWVLDSGYFQDPDDFTLVGTTKNDDVREFYIPDTVVRLTRQQLITRILGIHARQPMLKMGDMPIDMTVMTDAEVTAIVEAWCDERGE
jgi:hypothetical protein